MTARPELVDQYHSALNAFAPPGKLIPKSPDSQFQRLLRAWAEDYALIHQFAENVVADCIPINTQDRLDEWEQSCGMPDCDAHRISTIEGRRAAVVGQISQTAGRVDGKNGSSSAPGYLKQLAANAGFNISIRVSYSPRFGRARFGQARFELPGKMYVSVHSFNNGAACERNRFGTATFGQRFAECGINQLECLFNKAGPARYQFFYTLDLIV